MVIAGYAVSRRPKDSLTLLLAALTAVLAGMATNPAWDSIRLMQWVMAGDRGVAAVIVLLPPTGQRVAFSLLVLYHFAGICLGDHLAAADAVADRPAVDPDLPPAPRILLRQQRLPVLFAATGAGADPVVLHHRRRTGNPAGTRRRSRARCSTRWESSTSAGCR